MLEDPHLQVCGMLIIENFEGFSLAGAIRMNRSIPPVRVLRVWCYAVPCYVLFGLSVCCS